MYSLSSVGGVFECRIANPLNLPPKGKYKGHNDMCGETSQPQPFHIAPNLVSSDILGRPNLAFERPLQTRNRHSQRPPRALALFIASGFSLSRFTRGSCFPHRVHDSRRSVVVGYRHVNHRGLAPSYSKRYSTMGSKQRRRAAPDAQQPSREIDCSPVALFLWDCTS